MSTGARYSHSPHNDVSGNDAPHTQWWSHVFTLPGDTVAIFIRVRTIYNICTMIQLPNNAVLRIYSYHK